LRYNPKRQEKELEESEFERDRASFDHAASGAMGTSRGNGHKAGSRAKRRKNLGADTHLAVHSPPLHLRISTENHRINTVRALE